MTSTELREWIKRRGLTQREAAELLAMSLDGLRKNLYGYTPVGAQTARLTEVLDAIWEAERETCIKWFTND